MKEFNNPEIELIRLTAEDVIATSNPGCDAYCENLLEEDEL